MRPSTRTAAAEQKARRGWTVTSRALFCLVVIAALCSINAFAQQVINPPTTTIQFGGIPNANSVVSDFTTPRGGVVLYGSAISAFTGKPVRHLWVGDNIHGICRTDPEIDNPAFHKIDQSANPIPCIFKLNGASVTGGPMAIDPTPRACAAPSVATNCQYLYLADVRNSQGVFRLMYSPDLDGGQGDLDLNSVFAIAGNPTNARFQGGQTGCQFPLNTTLTPTTQTAAITSVAITGNVLTVTAANVFPIGAKVTITGLTAPTLTFLNNQQVLVTASSLTDFSAMFSHADVLATADTGSASSFTLPKTGGGDSVALGPDGNLYVTFKKSGAIARVNNPAAATSTGFGTCADFVQVVATTPDNRSNNGVTWLGHNLWGLDGTGPFVIVNADTTCQALGLTPTTTPTCAGDTTQLAAAAGAADLDGDQTYPALNGDNLYFGLGVPGNTVWATNVSGGPAVQQVDTAIINTAQLIAAFPTFPTPLGNVGGMVVDRTDPANLMTFSGEDFSTNGALGAGRWFETCQGNPPAAGAFNCPTPVSNSRPGVPTVARAQATKNSIQVSWTPAQSHVPVTSYTVTNTVASNGILLPPVVVGPGVHGFPPTSVTINPGAVNGSYVFVVAASNGPQTSLPSDPSASVVYPSLAKPGIPTRTKATAGDHSALVNWTAPASAGDSPITSYTVSAIANNVIVATSSVLAPSTSAVVNNLSNGTKYTFSVHATSAAGNSLESTPSDPPVVPAPQAQPVSISVNGISTLGITPTQLTYPITVTNNTQFPIANASLTIKLTQNVADGAFLILAQPTVGTCSSGGIGVTQIVCSLAGVLNPLQTISINAIAQIQGNGLTIAATFNGIDAGLNPVLATGQFITAPAPPPTNTVSAPLSLQGNAQVPNPNVGQAGNIVWTISNTSQNTAPNVVFTNTIPAGTPNGLVLNTITVTENNAGVFNCTFTPNSTLIAVPCPVGAIGDSSGGVIVVTTAGLGGSTKNGAKPPQTMIVTVNVTAPNQHGELFVVNGNVTFGPGGTDTLPSNVNVNITVK